MKIRRLRLERLENRQLLAGDVINVLDRTAVVTAYHQHYKPNINVPVEWTGSVAGCVAGTVSSRTEEATLKVLNYFRNMSGIEGVELDATFSANAQQAALMMQAQNSLSHSPDMNWACYTAEGAVAAGKSNLFLGVSGPRAITGYIEDPGSGNTAVGHRRWIQNPFTDRMGIGSTSNANALYTITPMVDRESPDWISWPPQGYVPKELVFPRWSLSRKDADFSSATVEMIVDGKSVPIKIENVANGYGLNTLVWEPVSVVDTIDPEEVSIEIHVGNVLLDGKPESFAYTVKPIHPGPTVTTVPAASDDSFATRAEPYAVINVMTNDNRDHAGWSPATKESLQTHIIQPPAHGSILPAVNDPGIYFYFPEAGFVGVDSFTYRIANLEQGRASSLATARITVLAATGPAWQNPLQFTDVNFDGSTTAADALAVINALNRDQSNRVELTLNISNGEYPPDYVDVNGDGFASAADALDVINQLNRNDTHSPNTLLANSAEPELIDRAIQSSLLEERWLGDLDDPKRKRRN